MTPMDSQARWDHGVGPEPRLPFPARPIPRYHPEPPGGTAAILPAAGSLLLTSPGGMAGTEAGPSRQAQGAGSMRRLDEIDTEVHRG